MSSSRSTYAVIGDPVELSLSPRIFAWLFQELGLDAHFTALRVTPPELPEAVARVRRGALSGLSVTAPHKEAIVPLLDDLHPLAARIGAVNCVSREETRVRGLNTDAEGFRAALSRAGQPASGARAVILGSGGAARAAAVALVLGGAKSVALANRTPERAVDIGLELVESGRAWPTGELARLRDAGHRAGPRAFRPPSPPADELGGPSGKCYVAAVPLEPAALSQALQHADLLVNATTVGLGAPTANPLPAGAALHEGLVVLDMVYRPLETALLRRARTAGAVTIDGVWMLVFQALEQLRTWTGRSVGPDVAARLHEQVAGIA